jgi:glycosyltransferase involved in cell wall biosynthesis
MRLAGVSIVLPCFNEVDNVAAAVREAHAAASLAAVSHEVVVVDDGSTDGTGFVVAGLAATDPKLRVVSHDSNRGYGAALRSGIAASTMPWVFLTDADLQFDLRELCVLVEFSGKHDVIVGRRVNRCDPLGRRLSASAWNLLVRVMFGVPVSDVDCAFKLIRRDLLERVELVSTGAAISTELVLGCMDAGGRLAEVGVGHLPRVAGKPTGGSPQVVLRAFRELGWISHGNRRRRHQLAPRPAQAARGLPLTRTR